MTLPVTRRVSEKEDEEKEDKQKEGLAALSVFLGTRASTLLTSIQEMTQQMQREREKERKREQSSSLGKSSCRTERKGKARI